MGAGAGPCFRASSCGGEDRMRRGTRLLELVNEESSVHGCCILWRDGLTLVWSSKLNLPAKLRRQGEHTSRICIRDLGRGISLRVAARSSSS